MENERFRKLKKQIAELEACFAVHSLPSNPFLRLDRLEADLKQALREAADAQAQGLR